MTTCILTLLATIAAEFLVLWPLTRKPPLKVLVYSILINSMTQPLATYVNQNVRGSLLALELGVVLVESVLIVLLFQFRYWRALLFSFLANFASALIGFVWSVATLS
jgi:hypothetical protein